MENVQNYKAFTPSAHDLLDNPLTYQPGEVALGERGLFAIRQRSTARRRARAIPSCSGAASAPARQTLVEPNQDARRVDRPAVQSC